MKFWALQKLLRLSLKRDVGLVSSSIFGIGLAVGSLLFFLGLGFGLTAFIQHLFPIEAKRVEIKAPPWTVGETEYKKLDEAACADFQKLEHVRTLFRKMEVRAPGITRINDNILGMRIHMGLEVMAVGVEPALFEEGTTQEPFVDDEEAVPVVLSSYLIDVYNQHFAPKNGMPLLKGDLLRGFGFDVVFNQSFFAGSAGERVGQEFFVAGFSPRAFLAGISIPLESAKRLNRTLGREAEQYSSVVVEVDDSAHLPSVIAQLEGRGFKTDEGERRWAQQLGLAIWATTGALSLLSVLIGLLAAMNIAQGLSHSLHIRESEFAIFRATGASSAQLVGLVFIEALVLALLGGGLGAMAAWGGGYLINHFLLQAFGGISGLPSHFFMLPPMGYAGGIGGAILAAFLGAWRPSRRLLKAAPAEVLAGR
ncbi:MAG: ABC transporter permease [Cystobacterineae bacterium]|nr:ABC transporter permease [Cystobacterineae bacterium]